MLNKFPIKKLVAGVPEALSEFAHSGKSIDFSFNENKYRVQYTGGLMHIDLIEPEASTSTTIDQGEKHDECE